MKAKIELPDGTIVHLNETGVKIEKDGISVYQSATFESTPFKKLGDGDNSGPGTKPPPPPGHH
jgi:hypothetical protein